MASHSDEQTDNFYLALPVMLQDISARIVIGVGVCGAADIGARDVGRISSSSSQVLSVAKNSFPLPFVSHRPSLLLVRQS